MNRGSDEFDEYQRRQSWPDSNRHSHRFDPLRCAAGSSSLAYATPAVAGMQNADDDSEELQEAGGLRNGSRRLHFPDTDNSLDYQEHLQTFQNPRNNVIRPTQVASGVPGRRSEFLYMDVQRHDSIRDRQHSRYLQFVISSRLYLQFHMSSLYMEIDSVNIAALAPDHGALSSRSRQVLDLCTLWEVT